MVSYLILFLYAYYLVHLYLLLGLLLCHTFNFGEPNLWFTYKLMQYPRKIKLGTYLGNAFHINRNGWLGKCGSCLVFMFYSYRQFCWVTQPSIRYIHCTHYIRWDPTDVQVIHSFELNGPCWGSKWKSTCVGSTVELECQRIFIRVVVLPRRRRQWLICL